MVAGSSFESWRANIRAISGQRFYFNYHHTAADTLDKIIPKELAENSAVVAVAALRAGQHGAGDAKVS